MSCRWQHKADEDDKEPCLKGLHDLHCSVFVDIVKQVPSGDVLHHQKYPVLGSDDFHQVDYIGVLQLFQELDFTDHLLVSSCCPDSLFLQDLH